MASGSRRIPAGQIRNIGAGPASGWLRRSRVFRRRFGERLLLSFAGFQTHSRGPSGRADHSCELDDRSEGGSTRSRSYRIRRRYQMVKDPAWDDLADPVGMGGGELIGDLGDDYGARAQGRVRARRACLVGRACRRTPLAYGRRLPRFLRGGTLRGQRIRADGPVRNLRAPRDGAWARCSSISAWPRARSVSWSASGSSDDGSNTSGRDGGSRIRFMP